MLTYGPMLETVTLHWLYCMDAVLQYFKGNGDAGLRCNQLIQQLIRHTHTHTHTHGPNFSATANTTTYYVVAHTGA